MIWKSLLFTWIILLWPCVICAENLQVTFLDVGEGDAVYLATPDDQNILIDTGNLITGYSVVRFLKERGVERLDALLVTHPHPDHMGGTFHLLQQIEIGMRYDNGQPLDEENPCNSYRWYGELFRKDHYKTLKAGAVLKFGDVVITVLSPDQFTKSLNDNSLVLKVVYGKTAFLFMGDAGKEVEKMLLTKYKKDLRADVIKVGHHGADDASSAEFLKEVSPNYAVVSVNRTNIRGYPSTIVLGRLQEVGAQLIYTYEGDVVFESDGKKIRKK